LGYARKDEYTMKNAVMYGGGNIGRGFIGTLFSASGYKTTFIDVAPAVVDGLNQRTKYPVRIISAEGFEDVDVINVAAVNGNDTELAASTIAKCDILATAVGVNILKFIIPNLVNGIKLRKQLGLGALNIIICENLMDANKVLERMLKEHLNDEECKWFDENIGLVEASIGRMVPIQTDEMKDGDPLRVCVERYGYLPVDKDAFKGEIPDIKNMIPFAPFDFYIKRKLYIHNMGHATCAYLGDLLGLEYIWESIDRDEVYIIVKGAMEESALALSKHYKVSLEDIIKHINDLLLRFTNKALKDTCFRVGGDPKRKLSPADRLIGSSLLAQKNGITPAYISIGAAAALNRFIKEDPELEQGEENALKVLKEVSGLEKEDELTKLIIANYTSIINGEDIKTLRVRADKAKQNLNVI